MMLSKRGFYNSVLTEIEKSRSELRKMQSEIEDMKRRIENRDGQYDRNYIDKTFRPQLQELKSRLENRQKEANKKIQTMCDSYIDELRGQDELRPEELTDDVKLLNSGVKLNSGDIKAMLRRNSENRTMLQIILRYAEEHNIETDGRMYVGNANTISYVKALPTIAETCIKWNNNDHVMKELVGDGSSMTAFFRE